PLSPNGKVDRAALPDPGAHATASEALAPRNPIEAAIAAIWAELLDARRIGVHDDFFALGGHSLLATRIASRLMRASGVELPLKRLFEKPTIAGRASLVEAALEGPRVQAPPIVPVDRDGPMPLSFAQQRLWFLAQLEPESSAYHVPAVLRMRGKLD